MSGNFSIVRYLEKNAERIFLEHNFPSNNILPSFMENDGKRNSIIFLDFFSTGRLPRIYLHIGPNSLSEWYSPKFLVISGLSISISEVKIVFRKDAAFGSLDIAFPSTFTRPGFKLTVEILKEDRTSSYIASL